MGDILVGTCSWTDPTLIECGRFYPDWAHSAEARLQYYASQFPIVEVDSSYYALPNEKTSGLWAKRTGDRFVFDIKAFRLFTGHPTPHQALPRDIRQALPHGLKEKANLYLRDLPQELTGELWKRLEQWYYFSFRPGSTRGTSREITYSTARTDYLSTGLPLNSVITPGSMKRTLNGH